MTSDSSEHSDEENVHEAYTQSGLLVRGIHKNRSCQLQVVGPDSLILSVGFLELS